LTPPFIRKILQDEIYLYRYPNMPSYVPTTILWPLVIIVPLLIPLFYWLAIIGFQNYQDFKSSVLAHTLAVGLNGLFVDIIKIAVGRPRPDFFYRCFPDGVMNSEMKCTGDYWSVMDGRKSFPSGHSSFSFAGLGFLAFYLMGKLKIFRDEGRGRSGRLMICFAPLVVAMLVAISRTCDYHHHW
jgi:diacylglycerol diphosphate phosphatase/phosphatidate phosphatase